MKGRAIAYSPDELVWLEANRSMVISDYHRAFCAAFGRREITALHLHGLRKRKGWKTGREGDRYKGRHRRFSPEEMAWLETNQVLPIAEYHSAFVAAFQREDVRAQNLHALRKRMGWKTGRTGRFAKGMTPRNKGVPCAPGTGGLHPNAQKTQFGAGERRGQAALNYKSIGSERISKDGYRERKVHDGLPMQSRWQTVQRIEWEALHGPIPLGMALKCKGDRSNTEPSNWELIPRAMLPRLNGKHGRNYDSASAELKPTIMAVAKLEHLTRTKRAGGQ